MKTLFWIFQSAGVTLKINSKLSKSNQFFPFYQQCIYASLDKIHPMVQKITHGNHISDISKCRCDLENKVEVTKIQSSPSLLPTMYLCNFCQNLPTGSEYNTRKRSYTDANAVRTKYNMSSLPLDGPLFVSVDKPYTVSIITSASTAIEISKLVQFTSTLLKIFKGTPDNFP